MYEFIEVEAYLFNASHPDDFTHKNPTQNIPNRFYFHKSGKSYKSGTYKCMDVTAESGDPLSYFGILI